MTKISLSHVCALSVSFAVDCEVLVAQQKLKNLLCIPGVKIQIQLLSGENLHIRDFHRTKVGDIATGISSQVRHRLEYSASLEE